MIEISATVPGGLQEYLTRELPDGGLVEFEYAPVGYLTKKGEPRRAAWRAYYYTPVDGKRTRFVSTTTLLDAICPMGGLPPWYEARGIEGTVEAVRLGAITAETPPVEAIAKVRALRLGADAARDNAADRGLNVHDLLREYMTTGSPPKLADHPESHRGYITALTRWLLAYNPEPVAVEQVVVHPEEGYAGRLDLRAYVGGRLITYDAKTQERAGIYSKAHLQVGLYERAAIRCEDDPADGLVVVVFAANGEYREMPADHAPDVIDAALAFYRAAKPIDSACESANRVERNSRKEPIAA